MIFPLLFDGREMSLVPVDAVVLLRAGFVQFVLDFDFEQALGRLQICHLGPRRLSRMKRAMTDAFGILRFVGPRPKRRATYYVPSCLQPLAAALQYLFYTGCNRETPR
jgi:hypothetical protein